MDKLPKRKAIRINNYDYFTPGAYFITVCVNGRKPILWNVGAATCRLNLSKIGAVVETAILQIPEHYPAVSVDKYCVMPDHIHMILSINTDEDGRQVAALFPFLVVYEKIMDKRYAKFEKEISSPIFYKTNGNFNLGNGKVKNGNIYFCESGIVCVCLEEKPYTLDEILLKNIDHYTYALSQLNIYTNDGRLFIITVPKADVIIDLLIRKGWITPR